MAVSKWKPDDELAPDALRHDALADVLLTAVCELKAGSVVSLEGNWGRGKTDLLRRVDLKISSSKSDRIAGEALWVNPWKYAQADLLSPVIIQLVERLGVEKLRANEGLKKAVLSIGRGLLGLAARGLGGAIGGGAGANLAEDALEAFINSEAEGDGEFTPDPVGALGDRFRELVDEVLKGLPGEPRLVVCVDDLDRCLPGQQVAMLEAIHFLTSAGARASFVVAIDPWLASEAIETHYNTTRFDTDRYLAKIFRLRLGLRGLVDSDVKALVGQHLEQRSPMRETIAIWLGEQLVNQMPTIAAAVLGVPDLRNPRTVNRIMDRLFLLSLKTGRELPRVEGEWQCSVLLAWLTISELWPKVRLAMQDAGDQWQGAWATVCRHARGEKDLEFHGIISKLPAEMPAFRQFIDRLPKSLPKVWAHNTVQDRDTMRAFLEIDKGLLDRGL